MRYTTIILSNQNNNQSITSNYNDVLHIVLQLQKVWLQNHLTEEENYIQFCQNEITQLNTRVEETERLIQNQFDQDICDNHRLNLQHYNNQLWRLSGNLLILEEEFDRIRNNVLYEISIIDTLLGN